MNFKGSIEPKDNPSITLYKAVDYNLNLQFSLEKEEKQFNKEISIQMITKDENNFNEKMKDIIKDLDLEKYSNNKHEHMENLKKFL